MTLTTDRITQKYIRRYPESKRTRSWAGRLVHIETENGVWREGGHGYTYADQPDAWVLPFEDAQKQVNHCGPEKFAAFIDASSVHSERFADWINQGPKLALAAGCYVGIKVTALPTPTGGSNA